MIGPEGRRAAHSRHRGGPGQRRSMPAEAQNPPARPGQASARFRHPGLRSARSCHPGLMSARSCHPGLMDARNPSGLAIANRVSIRPAGRRALIQSDGRDARAGSGTCAGPQPGRRTAARPDRCPAGSGPIRIAACPGRRIAARPDRGPAAGDYPGRGRPRDRTGTGPERNRRLVPCCAGAGSGYIVTR
jgi:hypothetical protein